LAIVTRKKVSTYTTSHFLSSALSSFVVEGLDNLFLGALNLSEIEKAN
jgi:hypothetical protein